MWVVLVKNNQLSEWAIIELDETNCSGHLARSKPSPAQLANCEQLFNTHKNRSDSSVHPKANRTIFRKWNVRTLMTQSCSNMKASSQTPPKSGWQLLAETVTPRKSSPLLAPMLNSTRMSLSDKVHKVAMQGKNPEGSQIYFQSCHFCMYKAWRLNEVSSCSLNLYEHLFSFTSSGLAKVASQFQSRSLSHGSSNSGVAVNRQLFSNDSETEQVSAPNKDGKFRQWKTEQNQKWELFRLFQLRKILMQLTVLTHSQNSLKARESELKFKQQSAKMLALKRKVCQLEATVGKYGNCCQVLNLTSQFINQNLFCATRYSKH